MCLLSADTVRESVTADTVRESVSEDCKLIQSLLLCH